MKYNPTSSSFTLATLMFALLLGTILASSLPVLESKHVTSPSEEEVQNGSGNFPGRAINDKVLLQRRDELFDLDERRVPCSYKVVDGQLVKDCLHFSAASGPRIPGIFKLPILLISAVKEVKAAAAELVQSRDQATDEPPHDEDDNPEAAPEDNAICGGKLP
jgi:hypothetical protein